MSGVTSGARAVFPPPHSVVRHQVDPDVYYYDSDSAGQGPGRATENRLQAPSSKACMSRQVRRSVEEGHARLVAGQHCILQASQNVASSVQRGHACAYLHTTVMASLGRPGTRLLLRRCRAGLKAAETCTILGCLPTFFVQPVKQPSSVQEPCITAHT